MIPHPFSTANYFHRSLNPSKNVKVGFSALRKGQTIDQYTKSMRLPELADSSLVGAVRPMRSADIP